MGKLSPKDTNTLNNTFSVPPPNTQNNTFPVPPPPGGSLSDPEQKVHLHSTDRSYQENNNTPGGGFHFCHQGCRQHQPSPPWGPKPDSSRRPTTTQSKDLSRPKLMPTSGNIFNNCMQNVDIVHLLQMQSFASCTLLPIVKERQTITSTVEDLQRKDWTKTITRKPSRLLSSGKALECLYNCTALTWLSTDKHRTFCRHCRTKSFFETHHAGLPEKVRLLEDPNRPGPAYNESLL